MTDSYSYIQDHVSIRSRLEQLAEEASEVAVEAARIASIHSEYAQLCSLLAKSAAKMIRTLPCTDNPAATTALYQRNELQEEYCDVINAGRALGLEARETDVHAKLARWERRVREGKA